MSRSLPTVRRHRRPRLADFRQALRSASGAIDLASIMVGVLVIGIIGGVIAVAVFAVIPWSQNEAAKSVLSSVKTAQSVAYVKGSDAVPHKGFMTATELTAAKLLPHSDALAVATDSAFNCFVAVSRSATGADYYSTDSQAEALSWDASISDATLGCTTDIRTQVGLLPISGGGNSAPPVADDPQLNFATASETEIAAFSTKLGNTLGSGQNGMTLIYKTGGPDADQQVQIPITGLIDATIYWGDGQSDAYNYENLYGSVVDSSDNPIGVTSWDNLPNHTYSDNKTYHQVRIVGSFSNYGLYEQSWPSASYYNQKLVAVTAWSGTSTSSIRMAFYSASNLVSVKHVPAGITNMEYAFEHASSFNGDISGWDTSSVTAMDGIFYSAPSFDRDLSGWDVSGDTSAFPWFELPTPSHNPVWSGLTPQ